MNIDSQHGRQRGHGDIQSVHVNHRRGAYGRLLHSTILYYYNPFCRTCQVFFLLFEIIFLKKALDNLCPMWYNIKRWVAINTPYDLGVAQLVARYLGVVEAVGSSPVTQILFQKPEKSGFFIFLFCNHISQARETGLYACLKSMF